MNSLSLPVTSASVAMTLVLESPTRRKIMSVDRGLHNHTPPVLRVRRARDCPPSKFRMDQSAHMGRVKHIHCFGGRGGVGSGADNNSGLPWASFLVRAKLPGNGIELRFQIAFSFYASSANKTTRVTFA